MNQQVPMSPRTLARFQIALGDASQSQLRAQYYQKRLETGAWRNRLGKAFIASQGSPIRAVPMTEEQLLQDEVDIMYQHIAQAEQHLSKAKSILAEPEEPKVNSVSTFLW